MEPSTVSHGRRRLFIYAWHYDQSKDNRENVIKAFCLDATGRSYALSVYGYMPSAYVEIPAEYEKKAADIRQELFWPADMTHVLEGTDALRAEELKKRGVKVNTDPTKPRKLPNIANFKPNTYKFEYANRLYYYNTHKTLYLKCVFKSSWMMNYFVDRAHLPIQAAGGAPLKVHEADDFNLTPIIKLLGQQRIKSVGWVEVAASDNSQVASVSHFDARLRCGVDDFAPSDDTAYPPFCILALDIECISTESRIHASVLPNPGKPDDVIFNIGVAVYKNKITTKYLLYLGKPNMPNLDAREPVLDNEGRTIIVARHDTEESLIMALRKLIRETNPQIITGYNVIRFDLDYILKRAELLRKREEFLRLGESGQICRAPIDKEEAQRTGKRVLQDIDIDGRIIIDMLDIAKGAAKLDQYTLKAVCAHYGIANKDPMTVQEIFASFGTGDVERLRTVGKYCVQDAYVSLLLFEKLIVLYELLENARTCQVPPNVYYNRGHQVRFVSQLYAFCKSNGFVIDCANYESKIEEYVGAYNLPPTTGLWHNVLAFDFCFTGDTLVSMSNGLSRRIDTLTNNSLLIGYSHEKGGFDNYSSINGLQVKGVRDTVKVYMQDGRVLTCTPDHKIMLANGEWERAQNLKGRFIKCGIGYTEDVNYEDEDDWSMTTGGYVFNMREKREHSLAFARVLGFVYADGCIYLNKGTRQCAEAYFGTLLDAQAFKRDLLMFMDDDRISIRRRECEQGTARAVKGITFTVNIPAYIARIIHSVKGITVGKRATQALTLPEFILDKMCPKSVVREFLAGLMGGDGCAPHLTASGKLCGVSFKWTASENYVENMREVFTQLVNIFGRLNINTHVSKSQKVKYYEQSIKPKNAKKDARYDTTLVFADGDNVIGFFNYVGFRYCVNKSYKLYIAYLYQTYKDNARRQKLMIHDRVCELYDAKGISIPDGLHIARMELVKLEPPLAETSMTSACEIRSRRGECNRHPERTKKISLQASKFTTFEQFIKITGTEQYFSTRDQKRYAVGRDSTIIPAFKQLVIDVRPGDKLPVYDIEVADVHNFVANGVCASNCSLYPSLMIAHNICFTTLVRGAEELKKLTPNDYSEYKWQDHVNCEHTTHPDYIKKPAGRRKFYICTGNPANEYNVIRFVKPHIRKGIVPQLVEIFLKRRKEVRKSMESVDPNDKETLQVLDKRQLSNKVAANAMYGLLGIPKARKGYVPLMEGAATITFMGRTSIKSVISDIEKTFNAKAVYGDTDSGMVVFNDIKNRKPSIDLINELSVRANKVTDYINAKMIKPMSLAYEGKVYHSMLILAKKRYFNVLMSLKVSPPVSSAQQTAPDATMLSPELCFDINCKGLPLKRRGYCLFMKTVYKYVIEAAIHNLPLDEITAHIDQAVDMMFRRQIPTEGYIVTSNIRDKYKAQNIAQARLAEKYEARAGVKLAPDTRVGFVYTEDENVLEQKHSETAELVEHFMENRHILRINNLDYLSSQFVNSIDQVLSLVYGARVIKRSTIGWKRPKPPVAKSKKAADAPKSPPPPKEEGFMERIYTYRLNYAKVVRQLKDERGRPPLLFFNSQLHAELYDCIKARHSDVEINAKVAWISKVLCVGDILVVRRGFTDEPRIDAIKRPFATARYLIKSIEWIGTAPTFILEHKNNKNDTPKVKDTRELRLATLRRVDLYIARLNLMIHVAPTEEEQKWWLAFYQGAAAAELAKRKHSVIIATRFTPQILQNVIKHKEARVFTSP